MRFVLLALIVVAAIVLGVGLSASAATKHHSARHVHPRIYNSESGGCTASGGPACSSACRIWPLCTTGQVVKEYDAQSKHRGKAEERASNPSTVQGGGKRRCVCAELRGATPEPLLKRLNHDRRSRPD